ncbi:MAG: hypothetical protein M3P11_13020 [Actinomycetota bacterium]|nr:hypothetical protein [Actinomycetota bacterium]
MDSGVPHLLGADDGVVPGMVPNPLALIRSSEMHVAVTRIGAGVSHVEFNVVTQVGHEDLMHQLLNPDEGEIGLTVRLVEENVTLRLRGLVSTVDGYSLISQGSRRSGGVLVQPVFLSPFPAGDVVLQFQLGGQAGKQLLRREALSAAQAESFRISPIDPDKEDHT